MRVIQPIIVVTEWQDRENKDSLAQARPFQW